MEWQDVRVKYGESQMDETDDCRKLDCGNAYIIFILLLQTPRTVE
jgi:hypothetical protein